MSVVQHYNKRGSKFSPINRFENRELIKDNDFLEYCYQEDEWGRDDETKFIEVFPKTILNKVNSPDIGRGWSMNPYQGCEHGCIYCYARNSHEYWGYNAGTDFERVILVKKNAPQLFEQKIISRSWEPDTIMLAGNTDCYQPIEAKMKITRQILELCWKYRHPISIITKNALVLRDLDILKKLASQQLVHVAISITSLDDEVRKNLEPRTASVAKRLRTVRELSKAGVPVNVMLAPMIPGINAHQLIPLMKKVGEAGAYDAHYLVVRLNGHNGLLFAKWLEEHYPDRKRKVLNQIKELHGGKVNDTRYGTRMKGEGKWAEELYNQYKTAKRLYFKPKKIQGYNFNAFRKEVSPQMRLFED